LLLVLLRLQIGSPAEVPTRKQFLARAGVVVYELHNYASAVRDAAVQLTSQPVRA